MICFSKMTTNTAAIQKWLLNKNYVLHLYRVSSVTRSQHHEHVALR